MERPPAHKQPCTLHHSHPTSVAFFDEAGAISSDRFFVVGLLRVADHSGLLREVKALRKSARFWGEFKWATITSRNSAIHVDLIDLILRSEAQYSAFVADRHVADPMARFGDTFRAYEKLATQFLIGSTRPYEIVTVLADNYSAPNDRDFQGTVKKETNSRLRRLAVSAVVQLDSAATEGLQLVDVLTGAVAFGFKAATGLASARSNKGKVAAELLSRLSVSDLAPGYEADGFRVRVYEHQRWLRDEQSRLAIIPAPRVLSTRTLDTVRGIPRN